MATADETFRKKFFEKHPNFFRDDKVNLDDLTRSERRNATFRRLLGAGQLLPVGGGEESKGEHGAPGVHGSSASTGISRAIEQQAARAQERGDEAFGAFKEREGQIGQRVSDIRGGRITPESEGTVLSEEGIQALLAGRKGELEALDRQNQEALFGRLSQRGLLPGAGQAGFSGPAAAQVFEERQRLFADPFTQFGNTIRAQVEGTRAERNAQLQQEATALQQFRTASFADFGKFFPQLELGANQLASGRDIAGRQIANQRDLALRGLAQNEAQFNQNLLFQEAQAGQAQRNAELARRESQRGGLLGGIGGLLGGVLGGGTGAGSILGGLGNLFGSGRKSLSNIGNITPGSFGGFGSRSNLTGAFGDPNFGNLNIPSGPSFGGSPFTGIKTLR